MDKSRLKGNKKILDNRSKKIPYVQVKQKNATRLKIELKTLLLSCIIYINAEAYYKPRLTSKTEIFGKVAKVLQLLIIFEKSYITES